MIKIMNDRMKNDLNNEKKKENRMRKSLLMYWKILVVDYKQLERFKQFILLYLSFNLENLIK